MDRTLVQVRALVAPGISLLVQPSTAQSFLEGNAIILWNSAPLDVTSDIREDFEAAIRRRGAKYYTTTNVLSYPRFCIALLCSSRYGLNHTTTPLIPARAYTAAWRGIGIVAATAKEETRSWLSRHVGLRSAEGYCSTLGIDTAVVDVDASVEDPADIDTELKHDEVVLSSITMEDQAICIDYSSGASNTVDSDSFTPEGQLMSLLVHYEDNLRSPSL